MATTNFTPAQEQAIRCIEKNVVVSAGAGSGKTRVLVERFVYILEQSLQWGEKPISPRDILAVTFTRKAATEMRDRIRQKLLEKIAKEEGAADFWRECLTALPRAPIGTLHSLCSAILRSNPVESDLDPAFSVMEELETVAFLRDRVRNWLRRQLKAQDGDVIRLCEEYGSSGLLRQILYLQQKGEIRFAVDENLPRYRSSVKELRQTAAETAVCFTEELVQECGPGNKKVLLGRLDAIQEALAHLEDKGQRALLSDIVGGLRKQGKNAAKIGKIKEKLERILCYPAAVRAEALIPCWERCLTRLQEHLYAVKKEAGVLAFDDLETLALDLLRNHPLVLEKYRRQYRYIMVDEFQDTNSRQRQLIYLLSGGDAQRLQGKHLFVVGDPKQSIYSFRGAVVSVFARVRHEIEAGGGVSIQLTDNFRTVDTILSLCNHLFPRLMGEDPSQDVFYEALRPHKSSDLRPEFLQFTYSGKMSMPAIRKKEALGLAARLRKLHETEGFSYGDMAILLQNMTHIEAMTAALRERKIPYAVVEGRGFYKQIEILDMINLTAFVSDPHDDRILLGLLRSVYAGLNDGSLTRLSLAFSEAKGREEKTEGSLSLWQFLQRNMKLLPAGQQSLLERSLILLGTLQREGCALNLPDFCRLIDETLHPETVLSLQKNGDEQLANYRKWQQMAFTFAQQKQGTVQDFARYLRRMQEEEEQREASASVEADAAVTLLTVHKAKGLEFPLVAVPFMDTGGQSDKNPVAWLPDEGLGISVRGENGKLVPSAVLQEIKEINRQKEEEEKARLLYVAMTRAEERLLLSGSEKEGKGSSEAKSWLHSVKRYIPRDFPGLLRKETSAEENPFVSGKTDEKTQREEGEIVPFRSLPSAASDDAADAGFFSIDQACPGEVPLPVLQQAAPLPDYGKFGRKRFSASSLQTYLWCPRRYYYQVIEEMPGLDEAESNEHALPAKVAGSIIHRTLEYLGRWRLEHPEDKQVDPAIWRRFYDRAVTEFAEGKAPLAQSAALLLEEYLHSPLYEELARRQRFAEYAFQIPFSSVSERTFILTGVVDAVAEFEGDLLEIIDYKTGRPPERKEPDKGYIWQLILYKMAVENRFGKKVGRASLYFLQNHTVWTLPESSETAPYLAEILALCEEIGRKKEEADFALRSEDCGACPFSYFCKKRNL